MSTPGYVPNAFDLWRNVGHTKARFGARVILPPQDGCVFVVSDQHYTADVPPSPAHRASVILANRLTPWAIVANGDAIDAAAMSRWPVSSFVELKERPTIKAELAETAARFGEYEQLKFVKYLTWNLGNHDARYETKLAEKVPEIAGVPGMSLKDHFPGWIPAWATWIGTVENPQVVIKHSFRTGEYSAYNNTIKAGVSMVTGHDHKLWVKPFNDYRGMRWGIDAGTISPVESPLFTNYTEDNPQDWQSGFVILHFKNGEFVGPELVWALPSGKVCFRGEVIQ